MIALGVSHQTSYEVVGHYIVMLQSCKTVEVIIIFLLVKIHHRNILIRTIRNQEIRTEIRAES